MSQHLTLSLDEAADRLAIQELVEAMPTAPIGATPRAKCPLHR